MTVRTRIAATTAALGLIALATAGPAAAAPAHPTAPGAVLTKATVFFHTNNEDTDDDTHVTVTVRDRRGTVAAYTSNDFGHFDDNSDAGPFSLQVSPARWDDVDFGTSTVRIDPNGNDTWRFNVRVDLYFSDGSHLGTDVSGIELTQDRKQQTWGVA